MMVKNTPTLVRPTVTVLSSLSTATAKTMIVTATTKRTKSVETMELLIKINAKLIAKVLESTTTELVN